MKRIFKKFQENEKMKVDFNNNYISKFGIEKYIYCNLQKCRIYNKSCIFYINKNCIKNCPYFYIGGLLLNFYQEFEKYNNFFYFLKINNLRFVKKDENILYPVRIIETKKGKNIYKITFNDNMKMNFSNRKINLL